MIATTRRETAIRWGSGTLYSYVMARGGGRTYREPIKLPQRDVNGFGVNTDADRRMENKKKRQRRQRIGRVLYQTLSVPNCRSEFSCPL